MPDDPITAEDLRLFLVNRRVSKRWTRERASLESGIPLATLQRWEQSGPTVAVMFFQYLAVLGVRLKLFTVRDDCS